MYGENAAFVAIAISLLAIAVVVFIWGVHNLVLAPPSEPFAVTITPGRQRRPVHRHRVGAAADGCGEAGRGGFLLQPFLVICIISASGHILTVGAGLSLSGVRVSLVQTTTELAVNAGMVLALSVALMLVRKVAGLQERV